jgi:hypothetical protein
VGSRRSSRPPYEDVAVTLEIGDRGIRLVDIEDAEMKKLTEFDRPLQSIGDVIEFLPRRGELSEEVCLW